MGRRKKRENRSLLIAIIIVLVILAALVLVIKQKQKEDTPPSPDTSDTEAPVISFDHLDPLYVKKGELPDYKLNLSFSDNVTAADALTVSLDDSKVDYDTPGIYTIIVNVSDEASNAASISRTLAVYTLDCCGLTLYPYDAGYDEMLDQIISEHTSEEMSLEQKLKACYDYVASFTYKGDVLYDDYKDRYLDYAERIIDTGKGACYAYAVVLETLFLKFNVPVIEVKAETVQYNGGYGEHFWTMAQLDGVWYHFDPLAESYMLDDDFFKIPSENLYNTGISRWDKTLYPWN